MARADVIQKLVNSGDLVEFGKTVQLSTQGESRLEDARLLLRWLAMEMCTAAEAAAILAQVTALGALPACEQFVLVEKWVEHFWRQADSWKVYDKVWLRAFEAGLVPTERGFPPS